MSDELRDIDLSEYSVSDSLKTTLRELPPYAALEDVEFLATELGIIPGSIIKVDGNENPYGPSDATLRALESLRKIRLHHYGDSDQRRLRSAIADHLSVGFDSVICGNGSDELIDLMFRLFINEGASGISEHLLASKTTVQHKSNCRSRSSRGVGRQCHT